MAGKRKRRVSLEESGAGGDGAEAEAGRARDAFRPGQQVKWEVAVDQGMASGSTAAAEEMWLRAHHVQDLAQYASRNPFAGRLSTALKEGRLQLPTQGSMSLAELEMLAACIDVELRGEEQDLPVSSVNVVRKGLGMDGDGVRRWLSCCGRGGTRRGSCARVPWR